MNQPINIVSSFSFMVLLLVVFHSETIGSPAIYIVVNRFEDLLQFDTESETPFKNCGGSESILKTVEVDPCNLKNDHCVISRGTNVTFKMSFLSNEYSKTLQTKIYGIIEYLPIPFPCPQPNGCENSGINCPVIKGHLYNYSISAPVLPKYPKASLWIKGELKDDNGDILVCVEIPVKIE